MHRRAALFQLDVGPGAWWNVWHYHADWPGWGNRGWRYRREHLRALCRVYQSIADARDRFATPFQAWICVSVEDAGQDATYLHTPNPSGTPFPFVPSLERSASSPLAAFVEPLLPDLTLDYGVDADATGRPTAYWIWARGVGEPLA